ncbi:hypothetical protein [Halomarina oriensis]|uniref:Uncharacterized protein n=1 Tax=Halomarina oriensis TaxID=671145 RepID=A0A6B0GM96_9EURY|nr:hypothetical protein [Halomarina oriensis]MWG35780.1 hypothetical protein [Halomarina oriensis]
MSVEPSGRRAIAGVQLSLVAVFLVLAADYGVDAVTVVAGGLLVVGCVLVSTGLRG